MGRRGWEGTRGREVKRGATCDGDVRGMGMRTVLKGQIRTIHRTAQALYLVLVGAH